MKVNRSKVGAVAPENEKPGGFPSRAALLKGCDEIGCVD
jgi:hypothetical protein